MQRNIPFENAASLQEVHCIYLPLLKLQHGTRQLLPDLRTPNRLTPAINLLQIDVNIPFALNAKWKVIFGFDSAERTQKSQPFPLSVKPATSSLGPSVKSFLYPNGTRAASYQLRTAD